MSKNKYFEDFNLGDKYILPSRTQTSGIFSMFQGVSGDNDPIHYDVEFCKQKGHKNISAKAIFKLSLQNKKWAKEIIDLSAKSVSELCANLKAIFDIDIIILGGSIGMAQGYVELVKKNLKKEPKLFHVKVVKSSLGVKASKMGVLL